MESEAMFGSIANWIYLGLAAYLVLVVAIGLYFSRGIKECDDHVLGGRDISFVYLVGSTAATWLCAGAILGAAGYAYMFGFQGTIYDPWAPALTLVLAGIFFVYRLRQAGYTSVVDFYDNRYGKRMSILYMIIQIIGTMAWLAGQMVAAGVLVQVTTGFSFAVSVIIGTIAVIILTYTGGLKALSRLDTMNTVLIIIALVILFPAVIRGIGGWEYFVNNARVWDNLPPFSMFPVPDARGFLYYVGLFGFISYLAAWLGVGLGDLSCAILMQRALAARTARTASGGFITAGVLYLAIALIPVMIGIAVFTHGYRIATPADNEQVLLWAAQNFMPEWFGVFFIVAIAGAIISTAGDSTLINATLLGHNVYRYFRPNATSVDTLKAVRVFIPITAIICMIIAIIFPSLYKLIVFAGAVGLPTVVPAYVAGLFWKKANLTGAVSSFFAGLAAWAIGFFWALPFTIEANWYMVDYEVWYWVDEGIWDALFFAAIPAAVVCVITLIIVSLRTQKSDPPKPMLSAKGESMEDKPMFFWSKSKEGSTGNKEESV
ncbi:MAG: sodium:solute symporter family transporter [Bacillota bacterium]